MKHTWSQLTHLWQRRAIRQTVQVIWVILILGFIGMAVAANWPTIQTIEWTGERLGFLLTAGGAAVLRKGSGGMLWVMIVAVIRQDQQVPIRKSLRTFFLSNLAMYLPGTYWYIPGRMMMLSEYGISAIQTGAGALLEQMMLVISGGLLSILGLDLVAQVLHVSIETFWWVLLIGGMGLVAIHPRMLNRILQLGTRLLRRAPITLDVSYRQMLLLLCCALLIWLSGALSLLFLARVFVSTLSITPFQVGIFGTVFAISWLAGFFTPIAPGGLGVREGVLGIGLSALGVPLELSILVAALSRLLIVFEDVFWVGIGLLL